jgi:hypothetical protein
MFIPVEHCSAQHQVISEWGRNPSLIFPKRLVDDGLCLETRMLLLQLRQVYQTVEIA